MKPTHTIDDNEWQLLIHHVAKYFDDLTIKRGFQYYMQGRVHSLTISGEELVEATVEGSKNYHVGIHLDSLYNNQCTCPVETNCKHMIAVLLDYAKLHERSIHAIVNAKSSAALKQAAEASSTHSATVDRLAGGLADLKKQATHMSTLAISEWHHLFELSTNILLNSTKNEQYVHRMLTAIHQIKPTLVPAMECLFELHAHLYVLEKLFKQEPNTAWYNPGSHIGYHTQIAADAVLQKIEQIYAQELTITPESETWQRVIETLDHMRMLMLTESKNRRYFSTLYAQLWVNYIHPNHNDSQIYLEELGHLQAAENELGADLSRLPWLIAQSSMHFYLSQDQEALKLIQAAGDSFNIHSDDVIPIFNQLVQTEDWSRLKEWLVEIGPVLGKHRNDNLHPYISYWETVIQHIPEADQQMVYTLARMLPYSSKVYEETLLTYGKWQQWMDYHLSAGNEPMEFRVSVFQPIEKHAPEMLLPFYHQAVERYVLQKNRDSYKAAVKLLKRLSKLYKKMKQEARWELFITSFSSRNSRLRALQEELRKGKLLP